MKLEEFLSTAKKIGGEIQALLKGRSSSSLSHEEQRQYDALANKFKAHRLSAGWKLTSDGWKRI